MFADVFSQIKTAIKKLTARDFMKSDRISFLIGLFNEFFVDGAKGCNVVIRINANDDVKLA